MFYILQCVLVFFIAASMINYSVALTTIAKAFEKHGVVPDVLTRAPYSSIYIKYPSGAIVKEGNQLTPTMVKDVPTTLWNANPLQFYTLALIDPDAPSRLDPKYRQWQHWLVGNILGNVVATGDTLGGYMSPSPPIGTGLHRYVFLVFLQPARLEFNEIRWPHVSGGQRGGFSITKFADKYNLGDPIAGNFFMAQFSR